ncbi:ABC transporter substrate-binding protein [Pseudoroseicyclus tamaricis]|uniref:sn-glycerol-3-phosphate-binding periplasmic protein UgpB n=1 Tax=Pseudoroseicyclus tamaricis TaxID=2705421 RepID=A0A6B2JP56_9RHOB|nr:extracellular solute-binding protein [Pseudoroseicyclus tamaricis]NDU99847.1 extracellular solute-binding protein [Pseudoroseicyclus tamaricis]
MTTTKLIAGFALGTSVLATAAAAQECGSDPVTLNAYFETGFPLPTELATEFTNQFPNVTFDIREDQFANLMENTPRLLSQENAPDLVRLPSISDLVTNGLLMNLDGYYEDFGWDSFPEGNLVQLRIDESGRPRGVGSLYAMGLNYSTTGIFYNKDLAEQIGMTETPTTLAELDDALAAAEEAGILPIIQWNKDTAGLAFPLQNLMGVYGDPEPINAWIFQQEGATIDTPENLEAAQHLNGWIEAGYFPEDANAVDYFTMMSRFTGGEGLFMFNGDWESANLQNAMGDSVGFFLMPPNPESGRHATMSSPLTFGIGANAENPDCAAFFLDWVATNETAREINVAVGGSNPGGPADMEIPPQEEGSLIAQTLAAGQVIGADNGAMDFIANATGAIFAAGWTPELQKMVGGVQDPEGLLDDVQEEYEDQLSR